MNKFNNDIKAPWEMEIKEASLKALRYRSGLYIDREAFIQAPSLPDNTVFTHSIEKLTDRHFLGIETFLIAGETYSETRVIEMEKPYEVPRNWWEHLKADLRRVLPNWAKGWVTPKFDVKWVYDRREVPVTITKCCPHGNFKWGDSLRYHVRWLEDPNPSRMFVQTVAAPTAYYPGSYITCPACHSITVRIDS